MFILIDMITIIQTSHYIIYIHIFLKRRRLFFYIRHIFVFENMRDINYYKDLFYNIYTFYHLTF